MKTDSLAIHLSFLALLAPPGAAQSFGPREVVLEGAPSLLLATGIADLDGDGRQDFLVGSNAMTWYRNDPAAGFVSQGRIGDSVNVFGLEGADIDLDGDTDLVVNSSANGLTWSENLGQAEFGPQQPVLPGVFVGKHVLAGDFDGDGDPDFVVELPQSNGAAQLAWVSNETTSGGGVAFGAPVMLSMSQSLLRDVVLADLDGDGDDDLLAASTSAGSVVFYHENTANGGFGPRTVLTLEFPAASRIAVSDVDGDGDQDLLATAQAAGRLDWVLNQGNGVFGPLQVGVVAPGQVRALAMLDVNGDGLDDCVLSFSGSPGVAVYVNTGGAFGPASALGTALSNLSKMIPIEIDLDGTLDLFVASSNGAGWYTGDGTTLGNEQLFAFGIGPAENLSAGDVDGDGDADLLVAPGTSFNGHVLVENFDGGTLGSASKVFDSLVVGKVIPVDIDLDGDLDLLGLGRFSGLGIIQLAENVGHGQFANPEVIFSHPSTDNPRVAFGDMEGDGDVDLLVTLIWTSRWEWVVNGPSGLVPGPLLSGPANRDAVGLADLNGDGLSDSVAFESNGNFSAIEWRPNLGAGTFGSPLPITASGINYSTFALGDLDGDGDEDLLVSGSLGTSLFENTGGGVFAPEALIDPVWATDILLRDLDGDGDLDAFLTVILGVAATWMENLGGGNFTTSMEFPGAGREVIALEDFDADLDLDVIRRVSTGTGGISINRNTEHFGRGYCGPAPVHSGGLSAAITASGSPLVAGNDVQLRVERLPAATFGFFLVADGRGFTPNPGGSEGNLCLGGAIGRLLQGPGAIFLTTADGSAEVRLELTMVPTPFGAMAVAPGDTRYAQAWFRDNNPTATSNFTNGLILEFE